MNKKEKEIAALCLSACMNDMRLAEKYGDAAAKEKAKASYMAFRKKLKTMLEMKYELFCLDYGKTVLRPMEEVYKIALVYYGQRVNGEELHYPA